MRKISLALAAPALALAACGQPAPTSANAQTSTTATRAAAPADNTALLAALHLRADASGQVTNACNEKVTPQVVAVDLGGAVGEAQLVIVPGGPNSASCYGDGPGDMHVLRRTGASVSEIYALQGAFLAVLTTSHNGVRDVASAGPGSSHPVSQWNGSAYVEHGEIADAAMGAAQLYPE